MLLFCILMIDIFLHALLFYFELLFFSAFCLLYPTLSVFNFPANSLSPISLFAFYSKHFVFEDFSSDLICIFHLFILFPYNLFCGHYTFLSKISFTGLRAFVFFGYLCWLCFFPFISLHFSPFIIVVLFLVFCIFPPF